MNGAVLYVVSFTIVPGYVVGVEDRHAILISRMQGAKGRAPEIYQATKQINDISPQAVLLAVLQGIATALELRSIAGVSAECQSSFTELNATRFAQTYDQFFSSLGALALKDGFYHLSLPLTEKPLNLIKPGHRKRTRIKRQVKAELIAGIIIMPALS
jgi:uncharacterized protein VirK/YbjX